MLKIIQLFDAVSELGTCDKVLDYGCGTGWASIIIAKNGCKDVLAVDIGEHIKDTVNFYASIFEVNDSLKVLSINPDWLKSVPSDTYDGIVCSNVLDVLPLETSIDIIKELARITKDNGKVIIGLNFYMSKEAASSRDMELVENKYLFVNDVLRLTSLSDEEWSNLFNLYFEIEKLDYFAWSNETKETRRLFILRKKLL